MSRLQDNLVLVQLYFERFSKYVLPRALVGFIGFLLFSGNIDLFSRFLMNGLSPILGDNYGAAYAVSVLTLYSVGWISYGFTLNALEALGFRNRKQLSLYTKPDIFSEDDALIIKRSESYKRQKSHLGESIAKNLYKRGDPLAAFEIGRSRLQEHVFRLQNNAIINLLTAIIIAIIGILVLGSAFLEIEKYHEIDRSSFKIYDFLVIAVIPRLSISLFLQIFAYFFLIMYRSNLADVRYFQNEMTNIDYHASAISMAMRNDNSLPQRAAISKLLTVERNRLMNNNQKVISSSDDAKLVEKMMDIEKIVKSMDRGRLGQ